MTAAVCRNGHLASLEVVDPTRRLERGGPWGQDAIPAFCGKCGSAVVTQCETCGEPIPAPWDAFLLNAFCQGCGRPYPWASREQVAGKLRDLLPLDQLAPGMR
jgi:hypothetical protein